MEKTSNMGVQKSQNLKCVLLLQRESWSITAAHCQPVKLKASFFHWSKKIHYEHFISLVRLWAWPQEIQRGERYSTGTCLSLTFLMFGSVWVLIWGLLGFSPRADLIKMVSGLLVCYRTGQVKFGHLISCCKTFENALVWRAETHPSILSHQWSTSHTGRTCDDSACCENPPPLLWLAVQMVVLPEIILKGEALNILILNT